MDYNSFWTHTYYGNELYTSEMQQLSQYFTKVFGLKILQIGCPNINYLPSNCKINHQIVISSNALDHLPLNDERSLLYCNDNTLPLATNSVDAVVIAHGLEFDNNPHQLLREVDRVLLPDGHLFILCFNPWSLWGARSKITNSQKGDFPWSGKWFSYYRVSDWLSLLDYEIEHKSHVYFKPCIDSQKILNFMRFSEQIGKIMPIGSAVFCISAKKKQMIVTPLKAQWKSELDLLGSANVVEPTMRVKLEAQK